MKKIFIIILSLAATGILWARDTESILRQRDYYFYAAQRHIALEQYPEALSCMLLCDALTPNDPQVVHQLGQFYEALGDQDEAYAHYKKAYELQPNEFWQSYWSTERSRSLSANDPKGALHAQDEIDKHQGRDRYSVYLRMRIGEITGLKWSKLVALYEEMLSYNPDDPYVNNNYAYGLVLHHGNLKRAEEMVQRALSKDPTNAAYLDTYATILEKMGKKELAAQYRRMIPKK